MCDRDLVRFELPQEKEGLILAGSDEIIHGKAIVAYGNTQGRGVITENKGTILAVGDGKIEIDAEVLQGNSGGPVVGTDGRVVGAVSEGYVDKGAHAKNTRYAKVRRFAVRVDGCDWKSIDYEDYRNAIGTIEDATTMIAELKGFIASIASATSPTQFPVRQLQRNNLYSVHLDYSDAIASLFSIYEQRAALAVKIGQDTGTYKRSVQSINQYKRDIEVLNEYEKKYSYDIPMSLLRGALSELKAIEYTDLKEGASTLIREIETVLIPAHEGSLDGLKKWQSDLNKAFVQDVNSLYREQDESDARRKKSEKEYELMRKSISFTKAAIILYGSKEDWKDRAGKMITSSGDKPDPDHKWTSTILQSTFVAAYKDGSVLLRNEKTFIVGASCWGELARWRRGDDIEVATAYNTYGERFGYWLKNKSLNVMIYAR